MLPQAETGQPDTDYVNPGKSAEADAAPQEQAPVESKHPAAAADEPVFPLADAGEYYIGLWNGHPNYGCPYCGYAILGKSAAEGDALVEAHIQFKIDQGSPKHDEWLKTI